MKHEPHILFVEDDLNNHPLYRDAFTHAGFTVTICQTAEGDFIDEVVAVGPDVISLDLMLGKEGVEVKRDGFDALTLLKADARTQDIPVFVLTNFSEPHKVAHAWELGAVDYLSLQGQEMTRLPEVFLRYLKKPKRYQPVHPSFRTA